MPTYYSRLAHHAVCVRRFLRAVEAAISDHRGLGMHAAADSLCNELMEGHWQLEEYLSALRLGVRG